MIPLTAIVTTRNEEKNIEKCLKSIADFVDEIFVIDSESQDNTVSIAKKYAKVEVLAYDHSHIIPWIFQWGLDHLPIRNEWVLILEADQIVTIELRDELTELFAKNKPEYDGYFIKRRQIFRGHPIRFGGYGSKYLLKLFKKSVSSLDPIEQDTRVYVKGNVSKLKGALEESNLKEAEILFYLEKHLRYAEAFAKEEYQRRKHNLSWKTKPKLFGNKDERVLWLKQIYYNAPLFLRSFFYFIYRYFILLGILDGANGFTFHFLQAFWFRWIVDIRLKEMRNSDKSK